LNSRRSVSSKRARAAPADFRYSINGDIDENILESKASNVEGGDIQNDNHI
jgi:hypothetical protein